ncbi:MAG: sulfatase [Verrucomicrobiota bacterium]|nr:sulfatase [Verrucomicrobiota bacterium]
MKRIPILSLISISCMGLAAFGEKRPNILWFVVDDMSANFSCYGENAIETPNVDKLAEDGLLFTRAYATSPVCSTFRTALITGMYQNSIGAHHHRSGRGKNKIQLPDGVRPIPEIFQEAGYFTCIGSGLKNFDFRSLPTKTGRRGKTDYNFDWDTEIYDSHDWSKRNDNQPFFMQVQLHGGKIRGAAEKHYEILEKRMVSQFGLKPTPHDLVELPPYFPNDSVLLRDWATYLDTVRITDWHVGQVIERLNKEDILDNTVIIFFTDHGISHARGKQFLYDEGTHIPLVIKGPGIPAGIKRQDLVEHIDIAALSLKIAGIQIPEKMEGQNILSPQYKPKEFIFAARDRCGEAADQIRSVRSEKFLYIKNFFPQRPHLMPSNYKDSKLIIKRLRQLHGEDKLNSLSQQLLFSPTRPKEELYLYRDDKWQIKNLANLSKNKGVLQKHRNQLDQWISRTNDSGPENLETYILETENQMSSTGNKISRENYRKNTEIYKRWIKTNE